MNNKQLMEILDAADAKNKRDGIVIPDTYYLSYVLEKKETDIYKMVEVVKDSANSYKIIPLDGCKIHLLGQDNDTVGFSYNNYYLVVSENNQLAIKVNYQESHCLGAKAIALEHVPNYLLVNFRGKVLSGQN